VALRELGGVSRSKSRESLISNIVPAISRLVLEAETPNDGFSAAYLCFGRFAAQPASLAVWLRIQAKGGAAPLGNLGICDTMWP
jgi:hypothetical protein